MGGVKRCVLCCVVGGHGVCVLLRLLHHHSAGDVAARGVVVPQELHRSRVQPSPRDDPTANTLTRQKVMSG